MKNEKKRVVFYAAAAFLLLIAASIALIWIVDNVFDGAVMDFLDTLVAGADNGGAVRYDRSAIYGTGLLMLTLFSAILVSACALCAYRVYIRQHDLLIKARLDAESSKRLAEREAQRKSDLITYLAHDLKTPLSSVIAYLSLLSESPEISPGQRAKYTGIALDKAYRLEQLTNELFEIIRFNLQTLALSNESINLRLMLMQLADEFYPILLPDKKTIRVRCDEKCVVRGDPDKLARVFANILKNALSYSYAETEILIDVARAKGELRVSFTNQGDMIPAEKLNMIFEKFYRLDASRSAKTGGAGLGLAIAKEIVKAHHGTISAESDEARTRFTVILPTM